MNFRRATRRDLDRLVEIHAAAYPDTRGDVARRRNFTGNALGSLDQVVVAVEGRTILAHAFLFELEGWFGGVPVPVGGIASVAVAPEARGRGVATALMDHLHLLSDARGDALTMLHAFRHGFYARLGYAPASSRKRLAIDTRSVPEAWRALARSRVRGVRGSDRTALMRVYARAAERSSGWMTRSTSFWERLWSREHRVTLVCEARPRASRDKIAGYVAFELVQVEPRAEIMLEVEELVHDDDEARRALVGALGAMRDQASELIIELPEHDPLERGLVDPDGRRFGTGAVEHNLGSVVGGPMVRIEDVTRAIEGRGYLGDGAFDVHLSDGEPSELGVRVRGGRAEVGGPAGEGAVVATTRAALAAILYGGLSVEDAASLGLAAADPGAAARIDAVVRLPPLCPVDAF